MHHIGLDGGLYGVLYNWIVVQVGLAEAAWALIAENHLEFAEELTAELTSSDYWPDGPLFAWWVEAAWIKRSIRKLFQDENLTLLRAAVPLLDKKNETKLVMFSSRWLELWALDRIVEQLISNRALLNMVARPKLKGSFGMDKCAECGAGRIRFADVKGKPQHLRCRGGFTEAGLPGQSGKSAFMRKRTLAREEPTTSSRGVPKLSDDIELDEKSDGDRKSGDEKHRRCSIGDAFKTGFRGKAAATTWSAAASNAGRSADVSVETKEAVEAAGDACDSQDDNVSSDDDDVDSHPSFITERTDDDLSVDSSSHDE